MGEVDHLRVWTFPLRGKGLLVLIAGIAHIALATLLASVSVPMIPALLTTFAGLYLGAFAYQIVRDTARGQEAIAGWPGLPNREAFFVPVARVTAGALWGCLPALLYRFFVEAPEWIFWLLFLLGVYFLPMVLVRVATRESFLAGQPMAVLISILRTLKDYTATCIPYYVSVFATALAATFLAPEGQWMLAGVAYSVALYLMLVEFYLLGLLHRRKVDRLHLRPFRALGKAKETVAEPSAPTPAPASAPADNPETGPATEAEAEPMGS